MLTKQSNGIAVPSYLSILEDTSATLTIEQIVAEGKTHKFVANTDPFIYLGSTESVWWFKLDLNHQSPADWYLQLEIPHYPFVQAFFVEQGSTDIQPLGDMRQDFQLQRLPTLRLPAQGKPYSLYLRTGNDGFASLNMPFRLLPSDQLLTVNSLEYLLYGGIFASLIVLTLYNLFLYISLRSISYLTISLLMLGFAFTVQKYTNIIPFLSPVSDPTTPYFHFISQALIVSAIIFWRQIVGTKQLFPVADKVLLGILLLTFSLSLVITLFPEPDTLNQIISLLTAAFVGTLGFIALKRGSEAMPRLSLAFFVFIASAIPTNLAALGIIKNATMPVFILSSGYLISAIFLSFLLAENNRQLRLKSERAEAENKAKDKFLTTMSHELRTPMYAVTSVAYLLKATQLTDKQKGYLDKLEISSGHMLELVNQILDLARIGREDFQLENRRFNLNELLHNMRQLLQDEANKKNLTFKLLDSSALQDKFLSGDATRVKQILLNLLFNAIKFTEQGSVTLTIDSQQDHNDATLTFTVSDTGIGVPEDQQKYIFHAFSQVDNSRSRHHTGSGLGLAISYRLVQQMGGRLVLESSTGKGSRFIFSLTFPIENQADITRQPDPATATTAPSTTKPIVLVVDDVPLNRLFSSELLKLLGIDSITADSGEDALIKLEQEPIDIIFMDISMPGMDGYETTHRIRSDSRFSKLPIIALTAHAIEGERERCLAEGMDDYLSKPFELKQLEEKIKTWWT